MLTRDGITITTSSIPTASNTSSSRGRNTISDTSRINIRENICWERNCKFMKKGIRNFIAAAADSDDRLLNKPTMN